MSNTNNEELDIAEEEIEVMDLSEDSENDDKHDGTKKTYLPGDPLEEGEKLVCDVSAYVMLHEAQTGAPCLSFDVIQNPWHKPLDKFPVTMYFVAGTQADETHANSLIIMKMSNMHKFDESDSEESDDDKDESTDEEKEEEKANLKVPAFKSVLVNHLGCVNRVRSMTHEDVVLAASWSELGRVNIWNITTQLKDIDRTIVTKKDSKAVTPLFSFTGHLSEGYGLDWNPIKKGMLATGDCKHDIHVWHPSDGAIWQVDQRPLVGHTDSVEDLQWSPNEMNVLASCSVDKSIRIWDVRSSPSKANKLTVENAHEQDVNVINWNHNEPFLVSGGDDGILQIWDLRQFKSGSPVASFKHHSQPVTTVEWHPEDGSVFASGGADNQIALWDIAVERDTENISDDIENVPSQLLFIHQGQNDVKELHWHPNFSGVIISTALSGFNVFKTISA